METNNKTEEHRRASGEKCLDYFQGNTVLPIPEISLALEKKILSYVFLNIKTRKFTGLKRDVLKEILWFTGILAKYFCRRSFATWDILLPSEEIVLSEVVQKGHYLQTL